MNEYTILASPETDFPYYEIEGIVNREWMPPPLNLRDFPEGASFFEELPCQSDDPHVEPIYIFHDACWQLLLARIAEPEMSLAVVAQTLLYFLQCVPDIRWNKFLLTRLHRWNTPESSMEFILDNPLETTTLSIHSTFLLQFTRHRQTENDHFVHLSAHMSPHGITATPVRDIISRQRSLSPLAS